MPAKQYTSEMLLQFIEEYLAAQTVPHKLKSTEIATFIMEKHCLIPTLTYQHFTRDKKAKQMIDDYNSKLSSLFQTSSGEVPTTVYHDQDFTPLLASLPIKKQEAILHIIADAHKALADTQTLLAELKTSKQILSEQENRIAALQSQLQTAQEDFKSEHSMVGKLKKTQKELISTIRMLKKYILHYISIPAMQKQLLEIGILELHSDDALNVPQNIEELLSSNNNLDDIVSQFFQWITDGSQIESNYANIDSNQKADTDSPLTGDIIDINETDTLNTVNDWIDKINNI